MLASFLPYANEVLARIELASKLAPTGAEAGAGLVHHVFERAFLIHQFALAGIQSR